MKSIKAKIVSIKMAKTVVVEVARQIVHPIYKKMMRRTSRFKAHSEDTTLKVGDMVKITSTRPLSKEKHFKVIGRVDKI